MSRAHRVLALSQAALLLALVVTAGCNKARVSSAQATPFPSPCAPSWTRIPGTFSFQRFNERHTARVFAFACPADIAMLPDPDWRKLMDLFRQVAEEKPQEWPPFRACDGTSSPSPLVTQANEHLGRKLLSDVCFTVTANVP